MELQLIGCTHRHATEQMALSLFPQYGPRVTFELPRTADFGTVTLFDRPRSCRAHCFLRIGDKTGEGVSVYPYGTDSERAQKTALRRAVFKAYHALSGERPPWGSLSGVSPVKPALHHLSAADPARSFAQKYDLSPRRAALAIALARLTKTYHQAAAPRDISIYVGIPFCPTKCAYCSFISSAAPTPALTEAYVTALCCEIQEGARCFLPLDLRVRSVYIGGGTPTFLSADQLARLLDTLTGSFSLDGGAEFTVEAGRPDTIDRQKLDLFACYGVSRLSVNPQSLQPQVLEAIGRGHSAADFFAAYALVREYDFLVNVDLIAGLPRESGAAFLDGLAQVMELGPDCVTLHTLSCKKGADTRVFAAQMDEKELDRTLAAAYHRLQTAGYNPYYLYKQKYMRGAFENTGFARPGALCRYNIDMMEDIHSVVAFGSGGSTKLICPASRKITRLANPKYAKEYIETMPNILQKKQDTADILCTFAHKTAGFGLI